MPDKPQPYIIHDEIPLERLDDPQFSPGPQNVRCIYLDGVKVWERGRGRLVPLEQLRGIVEVSGVRIDQTLS